MYRYGRPGFRLANYYEWTRNGLVYRRDLQVAAEMHAGMQAQADAQMKAAREAREARERAHAEAWRRALGEGEQLTLEDVEGA